MIRRMFSSSLTIIGMFLIAYVVSTEGTQLAAAMVAGFCVSIAENLRDGDR